MSKRFITALITSLIGLVTVVHPVYAASARLQLTPSALNLKPGETKELTLTLIPKQLPVVGVDVFLIFDPSYFTIESIQETGVFSMMPALNINNQTGQAKFSLAHTYGIHQLQTAKVATLTLKAKTKQGASQLNFQYAPNQTTDSNIVIAGGTDVLETPNSVKITVKQTGSDNKQNNSNANNSTNANNNNSNESTQSNLTGTADPNILGLTDAVESTDSTNNSPPATVSATPSPSPTPTPTPKPQALGITDHLTQPPLSATSSNNRPWQLVLALGITLIITSSTTAGYWWGKHRANNASSISIAS